MTSWVHSTTIACSGDFVHTNTASAHMVAAQIQFEKKKLKLSQTVYMCFRCCALNDPSKLPLSLKGSNKQGFHDEDRQKGTQRGENNERSAFSLFFTDSLNMCLFRASAALVLYVMHGRESASHITKKKNTQTQLREVRDLNCFLFIVALYWRKKNVNLEHFWSNVKLFYLLLSV